MPICKTEMLYRCVSSLMYFQWNTGRFLLLCFAPDWTVMSLKVQQSLPWERGSGGCYTPYSVEVASLTGLDSVMAVCWVLWSQNLLGWYPAFKFQIRMFQGPEYADIFFKIWKLHIPVESYALVGDRRTPLFRSGIFLRAFANSAKSGNAAFKNWIPQAEEGNKSWYIFAIENKKIMQSFHVFGVQRLKAFVYPKVRRNVGSLFRQW